MCRIFCLAGFRIDSRVGIPCVIFGIIYNNLGKPLCRRIITADLDTRLGVMFYDRTIFLAVLPEHFFVFLGIAKVTHGVKDSLPGTDLLTADPDVCAGISRASRVLEEHGARLCLDNVSCA